MRFLLALTVLVLLAACQAPLASLPPAVVVAAIEGRIGARSPAPDEVSFTPVETYPQERVPVRADGTFTLPLPQAMEGAPINWALKDCSGSVAISNPAALQEELTQVRFWSGGVSLGGARVRSVSATGTVDYLYLYSTQPTVIRGGQVCPNEGNARYSFQMNLGAGWNLVRYSFALAEPRRYAYESLQPMVLTWQ